MLREHCVIKKKFIPKGSLGFQYVTIQNLYSQQASLLYKRAVEIGYLTRLFTVKRWYTGYFTIVY